MEISSSVVLVTIGVAATCILAAFLIYAIRQPSHGTPAPGLDSEAPTHADDEPPIPPPNEVILRGLQDLVKREAEDAQVVFEHADTHKLIQFSRTANGVAMVLPTGELSPQEQRRAGMFVQRLSAKHMPEVAVSETGGRYRIALGDNYVRAAELGSAAFRDVYELSGRIPLLVTTK